MAFVPIRMKYLQVRWVAKGATPFHSAAAPSSRAMVRPQWSTPPYRPAVSSWMRVLMVSMGCRQHASTRPPMLPATALTDGLTSTTGACWWLGPPTRGAAAGAGPGIGRVPAVRRHLRSESPPGWGPRPGG